MEAKPFVADLFSWPRSGLRALGDWEWGVVLAGVYVCAIQLQKPTEVDSCQARSTTLRQGLTKRLNTALGFPASMSRVEVSVSEMCVSFWVCACASV